MKNFFIHNISYYTIIKHMSIDINLSDAVRIVTENINGGNSDDSDLSDSDDTVSDTMSDTSSDTTVNEDINGEIECSVCMSFV